MFHRAAFAAIVPALLFALAATRPPTRDYYPASLELDIRASFAADVPVDWFLFEPDPELYPELTSTDDFWKVIVNHQLWERCPGNVICGIEIPPYSSNLFQARWITNLAGLDPSLSEDPEWLCNYVVGECP
jgi:hypothetical protein